MYVYVLIISFTNSNTLKLLLEKREKLLQCTLCQPKKISSLDIYLACT